MNENNQQQQPQPVSVRTEFQVYLTVSMDFFTTAEKFITMYYTYPGAQKYADILREFIKDNDGYYIGSTLYGPEDIRVSIRRVTIEDNLPF